MLWNNGLSSGFTPYQTFIVPPKNLIKKTCETSVLLNGYCGITSPNQQRRPLPCVFILLLWVTLCTVWPIRPLDTLTHTVLLQTNCTDTVHTREDTVCISQMDRLQIKIINHSHFFTPSKMNSKFPRYTVTRNIEEN